MAARMRYAQAYQLKSSQPENPDGELKTLGYGVATSNLTSQFDLTCTIKRQLQSLT